MHVLPWFHILHSRFIVTRLKYAFFRKWHHVLSHSWTECTNFCICFRTSSMLLFWCRLLYHYLQFLRSNIQTKAKKAPMVGLTTTSTKSQVRHGLTSFVHMNFMSKQNNTNEFFSFCFIVSTVLEISVSDLKIFTISSA